MNNYLSRVAGLVALTVILAGCGSSPRSNHYVLTAHPATPPGSEKPSLGIGPIEIPEYLNRNSMVYNRQGNKLRISSTERWAEPLEDGLKRVISLNLATLVGTQNVRFFPWSSQRAPDYAVKVNLLTLDADDKEARLVAEWLVYRPATSETVRRRISDIAQPLPGGEFSPEQIAPAYSELLYRLSEIIAQAITAAEAAQAAQPQS